VKLNAGPFKKAIRAKHCSYSCIAERFHVGIDDVRRIAKPIQQQWSAERRAQRELDRITKEAEYDRKPYDNQLLPEKDRKKCSLSARVISVFIIICILLMIGCITLGLARWALGF